MWEETDLGIVGHDSYNFLLYEVVKVINKLLSSRLSRVIYHIYNIETLFSAKWS